MSYSFPVKLPSKITIKKFIANGNRKSPSKDDIDLAYNEADGNEQKLETRKNDCLNITGSIISNTNRTCRRDSGTNDQGSLLNNYVNYVYNTSIYEEEMKGKDVTTKDNKYNNDMNMNMNMDNASNYNNLNDVMDNVRFSKEVLVEGGAKLKPETNIKNIGFVPNMMSSSNFSFEKFIRKSNSLTSFNKELTSKIAPTQANKKGKDNFKLNQTERTPKLKRNSSNLNRTVKQTKSPSVKLYLERRHLEEVEKVNQLRHVQQLEEEEELQDRPLISSNSKKIISFRPQTGKSVFERLSDQSQFAKKREEINMIEHTYVKDKYPHQPKINNVSKLVKRNINDLFDWQRKKEEKMETERREKSWREKVRSDIRYVEKLSEDILRENNPRYLGMKVEDRLLEKAQITKNKIEGLKRCLYGEFNNKDKNNLTKKATTYNCKSNESPVRVAGNTNTGINKLNIISNESGFKRKMNGCQEQMQMQSQREVRNNSNSKTNSLSKSPIFKHQRTKSVLSNTQVKQNNYNSNNYNNKNYPPKDEKVLEIRKQLHNFLNARYITPL